MTTMLVTLMTTLNCKFAKYSRGDYYCDDHYTCKWKEASDKYFVLNVYGGPTLYCPYYINEQAITLCKYIEQNGDV